MRKKPGQPNSVPSSWLSQSSVLAKRLCTTRTTQTPPARVSTLHSVAIVGMSGVQPGDSAVNFRGGSQLVTVAVDSIPGSKLLLTATGLPSCSTISVGTNQDETPGPVAMACQTSSGVPGTSTSTCTERRPEASFFTLMMAPWDGICNEKGTDPFGQRQLARPKSVIPKAPEGVSPLFVAAAEDAPRPPGDARG